MAQVYILVHQEARKRAKEAIDSAPDGYACRIGESNRTTDQNAAQWPILECFAKQRQWPVNGKVIETFGKKENGLSNEGIVIAANEGTPIAAVQAGEVAFVGDDSKNYGKIVILRHADGNMTSYSHAQSISVKKGDQVNRGSVIGYVGKTGNAKEPQLHFAVREGNHGVDPLTKLPQHLASN